MKKFIIVSGTNRSGTSALMYALKMCGIDVGGFKYPLEVKQKDSRIDGGSAEPTNDASSNPTGFWEYPSISMGGLQSKHIDYEGLVVKVILSYLGRSDPAMINKVILIVRNPRSIIASRIKCGMAKDEEKEINANALTIMNNYCATLHWLKNKNIRFRLVIYEELIENPVEVLSELCESVGYGYVMRGSKVIDKYLNRSVGVKVKNKVFKKVDTFYQDCVLRDYVTLFGYDLEALRKEMQDNYIGMIKP